MSLIMSLYSFKLARMLMDSMFGFIGGRLQFSNPGIPARTEALYRCLFLRTHVCHAAADLAPVRLQPFVEIIHICGNMLACARQILVAGRRLFDPGFPRAKPCAGLAYPWHVLSLPKNDAQLPELPLQLGQPVRTASACSPSWPSPLAFHLAHLGGGEGTARQARPRFRFEPRQVLTPAICFHHATNTNLLFGQ